MYNPNERRTMGFHAADGKQVGVFDFTGPQATFEGDVDESAKIFVEAVIQLWGLTREDPKA